MTFAPDEPLYFDYGKNPKTPNLSPCQDKNGAGSGISPVYLWLKYKDADETMAYVEKSYKDTSTLKVG